MAIQPPECWLYDSNPLLVLCAKSAGPRRYHKDVRALQIGMIHDLGLNIRKGDLSVREFLSGISPVARYELFRCIVPELAAYLSTIIELISDFEVRPPSRKIVIPDTLPSGLAAPLHGFHDKTQNYYNMLLSKGHIRNRDYVWYVTKTPILFAEHLFQRGIESWDVVRKRDVVTFLQENPGTHKVKVLRFMRYVNERQPFRETRGRPRRSQGGERRNVNPPVLMSPEELDAFLANIRSNRSDAEYLLAWLTCRMGMMSNPAYNLTIDKLRINDMGRLVIRPSRVWVAVPRSIELLFFKLIDKVVSNWRESQSDQIRNLKFFHYYIPIISVFNDEVMQNRTRVLRASAVFAAMMKGQIDRVTLHQTMGASIPFIVKLELLMSVDMHRSLSAELVKNRNDHILGNFDE